MDIKQMLKTSLEAKWRKHQFIAYNKDKDKLIVIG
jgi:hypothetical protein